MAGRPSKPDAIKTALGNPGKRKINRTEPDPTYLNDLTPPEWLSTGACAVWIEEAPKYRRARLLTEIDVVGFAQLCQSIHDYRRAVAKAGDDEVKAKYREDDDGNPISVGEHVNPWSIVKSMAAKQVWTGLSKFGGTPADRTRVSLNPQASLFDNPAGTTSGNKKDKAGDYFH